MLFATDTLVVGSPMNTGVLKYCEAPMSGAAPLYSNGCPFSPVLYVGAPSTLVVPFATAGDVPLKKYRGSPTANLGSSFLSSLLLAPWNFSKLEYSVM